MSPDDAKRTLGIPPNSTPPESELRRIIRQRMVDTHPDRGGDEEAFKAVEQAGATLLGKGTSSRPSHTPSGTPPVRWTPPPEVRVTFQEAVSKASIPSGVKWLFVTPPQRGTSWSSDESAQSESTFVAYGRTDSQHVFVGAHHYTKQDYYVGGVDNKDLWTVRAQELPIKAAEGNNPAWLYGNVARSLKAVGFSGKFNSKVLDAADWKLGDKTPHGAATSLKHWLVNSGQVKGDAASVAGRKHVVELTINTSLDQKPGFYPQPASRSNTWDGRYHGDYYKFSLTINGKGHELSPHDTQALLGGRLDGKRLLDLIFGEYHYSGTKKQLTRLRHFATILEWMAANFKNLPEDAIEVLKAAAAQKKA